MKKKVRRIFIGPHEIAGYYAALSEGFRMNGVECDYILYEDHPFRHNYTQKRLLSRTIQLLRRKRKSCRSFALIVLLKLTIGLLQFLLLIIAIFRYDTFILSFGVTLFPKIDLPLLRLFGKNIIVNLGHGSEARPSFIDGGYQSKDGDYPHLSKIYSYNIRNYKNVQRCFKYAHFIIGSPFSTSQFAPSRFINWFALGIPAIIPEVDSVSLEKKKESQCIHILHSPSHPPAKGTPIIMNAIDHLKRRGHNIQFVMLQGVPHQRVIEEIKRCDFVVDQVYCDTPMAGFATEAACYGKPAIVGGYRLDYLRQFVPRDMWPPSKICHPDQIERAIEELIVDAKQRRQLGFDAYMFVRTKWNAAEVARRYIRLIEGDIPDDWWVNPRDIIYLEGIGQPIERTKQIIRDLVQQYGVEALQLSHRPDLCAAFLEFAGINHGQEVF